jgi:hypothetical protein
LERFVQAIEAAAGKKAKVVLKAAPPGDVTATAAKVEDLGKAVDFRPKTSIEDGMTKFVDWYREYAGFYRSPFLRKEPIRIGLKKLSPRGLVRPGECYLAFLRRGRPVRSFSVTI